MFSKLFKFMFLGILSVVPLAVVIIVVYWLHDISVQYVTKLFSITNSTYYTSLIIVLSLALFVFLGYSIEKFGKSFILSSIEAILEKIPAIRTLYSISKKIVDVFASNSDDKPREVVLIEYPKKDIWVPAYVFNRYETLLVLFIPTSPNPTSGYTVIMDEKYVTRTTMNIEEASKFIISMGTDFVKKEELFDIICDKNMKEKISKS